MYSSWRSNLIDNQDEEEIIAYFNRYKEFKKNKSAEELEELIRDTINSYPYNDEYYIILVNQLIRCIFDKTKQNPELQEEGMAEVVQLLSEVSQLNPVNLGTIQNQIKLAKIQNNEEDFEKYLRKFLRLNPLTIKYRLKLVEFLFRKAEKDPDNSAKFLGEARQLLLETKELRPSNSRVLYDLITLRKLENDEKKLEIALREYIKRNPNSKKAKTRLAHTILDKCKNPNRLSDDKKESILCEAEQIAEQILRYDPENTFAIGIMARVARYRNDPDKEIELLRKQKDLGVNSVLLDSLLVRALLASCIKQNNSGESVNKNDERITEAKQICLALEGIDAQSKYVQHYLSLIERLQGDKAEEIELSELMESDLPEGMIFTEEDFTQDMGQEKNSQLMQYRGKLMSAISSGDRTQTIQILKEMRENPVDGITLKQINSMLELAKSKKPAPQMKLKEAVGNIR